MTKLNKAVHRLTNTELSDCYAYALKCRSNRAWAQKMAGRKAKKAIRLAAQRQMRAEKRLFGEYPKTIE